MSLLEDMKTALKAQGYYGNVEDASSEIGAEIIVYQDILDRTRWGHIVQDIVQRGDELVAVVYESASGDDPGEFYPEVYKVVAQTVTTTKYIKVD